MRLKALGVLSTCNGPPIAKPSDSETISCSHLHSPSTRRQLKEIISIAYQAALIFREVKLSGCADIKILLYLTLALRK